MINTGRMLVKVLFFNIVNHHMQLAITTGNFSFLRFDVLSKATSSCTYFTCRVQCMAMCSGPRSNPCFERPIVGERLDALFGANPVGVE
jgi:hypothetical protein